MTSDLLRRKIAGLSQRVRVKREIFGYNDSAAMVMAVSGDAFATGVLV